jgi:pimeloyl-ACP methyl ester carboxylesterase
VSLERPSTEKVRRLFHKAKFGLDKFILVQHYKIHYVEAGQELGEPIILIPGSYSTYRAWNRVMPLLAGQYRLLALDYVGVGDSDKPRSGFEYTIQEQTDLIAKMVAQMNPGKVHLVGGSYGGAIVFDFAARYPELVNKIVSIEGGIIKPENLKGAPLEYCLKFPVIGDIFVQVTRTGMLNKPAMKLLAGKWYTEMTSDDRKEVLEQINSNAKSASRIPWHKISLARKTSKNIEEEAKSIKSPILYLYGTKSDFKENLLEKNLEYLKTFLPHAWIVAMEGGIHDMAMQKPVEVASIILEFLRNKPLEQIKIPNKK